jgi:hypothetical protein
MLIFRHTLLGQVVVFVYYFAQHFLALTAASTRQLCLCAYCTPPVEQHSNGESSFVFVSKCFCFTFTDSTDV